MEWIKEQIPPLGLTWAYPHLSSLPWHCPTPLGELRTQLVWRTTKLKANQSIKRKKPIFYKVKGNKVEKQKYWDVGGQEISSTVDGLPWPWGYAPMLCPTWRDSSLVKAVKPNLAAMAKFLARMPSRLSQPMAGDVGQTQYSYVKALPLFFSK